MADEVQIIESKDQLKQAISKTPVCVLFASVEGRDAVNASAQEDFESAFHNTSKRTFAKVAGDKFKSELEDVGIDMGATPYLKFAIFVNQEVKMAEDVVDMELLSEVSKFKG